MAQQTTPAVPSGYMKNARGHLVPLADVREQDLLRDEAARSLAVRAIELNAELKAFKAKALSDIIDLVRIAGERYDVALGGKKGNVSISTYDGEYKVRRTVADRIEFTEEIEAAKALLNSCIERWSQGANPHIRVIVDRAFSTDSKGQLKTAAVLDLMRVDIDDAEWLRAMEAIKDSIQATGTATYIRVYRRVGDSGQYVAVPLDLAVV